MPLKRLHRRLDFFGRLIQATYMELFLFWILMNMGFTALYFILSLTHPHHAPTIPGGIPMWERLVDSLYFSVMTATTTGYGDMVPLGMSKVLAMIECTVGVLVFTVLVGKLVAEGARRR